MWRTGIGTLPAPYGSGSVIKLLAGGGSIPEIRCAGQIVFRDTHSDAGRVRGAQLDHDDGRRVRALGAGAQTDRQ